MGVGVGVGPRVSVSLCMRVRAEGGRVWERGKGGEGGTRGRGQRLVKRTCQDTGSHSVIDLHASWPRLGRMASF